MLLLSLMGFLTGWCNLVTFSMNQQFIQFLLIQGRVQKVENYDGACWIGSTNSFSGLKYEPKMKIWYKFPHMYEKYSLVCILLSSYYICEEINGVRELSCVSTCAYQIRVRSVCVT